MLVARPSGAGFRVVDAFSRITRLGEGLAATGRLSEAAMERTVEALKACVDKMVRNRVTSARLVATEACRQACNCADFAARVGKATGLDLDIISPHEEARLALSGCAGLLDSCRPWGLVFDIGGGSTEVVWVENAAAGPRVEGVLSVPLGVVTLAEARAGCLCTAAGYARVVDDVADRLAPFETSHGIAGRLAEGAVQMLGTSGTVTTLAAVHMELGRYERSQVDGADLAFADIAAVTRKLSAMSALERAQHPCIGPDRADLVIAGCAIIEAMCRLWPLGSLRVADRGVREGVLLSLMKADALAGARA
ncbi:MAG: Ppx/GppA family phosphatase [Magnetospirillum sp.]|nr:Ppx/GppA family phosphatase [Magnetospirillum sp.]